MNHQRLDRILVDWGWISGAQVNQALNEQKRRGTPFGSTLVHLGHLTEAQLAAALAEQHQTPTWDPEQMPPETEAVRALPESWAREKGVLPLRYDTRKGLLIVAMTDPSNRELREEIRQRINGRKLGVVAAPTITMDRLWAERSYQAAPETPEATAPGSAPAASGLQGPQGMVTRSRSSDEHGLGIEFSFSGDIPRTAPTEAAPIGPRVLLWLSQVYVTKLFMSLLGVEGCQVAVWDGNGHVEGQWDYLVYDDDNAASSPEALSALKRKFPKIQMIPRPTWTTCLLRSPISYQVLRDGYIGLAEYAHRWVGKKKLDPRVARYALAIARVAPMTPFEVDTLIVSFEMAPLFLHEDGKAPDWNNLKNDLRSPFPVFDIFRAASVPFRTSGAKPGVSTPESPFSARIYHLVFAFLRRVGNRQLSTIQALSEVTDWLRERAQQEFDPVAVEALLRVMREEVLDGCLPPGPAEAILVADHPMDWSRLSEQLRSDGWVVVLADGVAEVRKLVERRCPDAVVWAAGGAIEWVHWQSKHAPSISSYLVLEEANQALARTALETGFDDVWSGEWDPGVAAAKLRRCTSRPTESEVPDTVRGSLEQLDFVDLVGTLGNGGRSVAIEMSSGDKRATVILWQGRVKFATTAELQGEEVVYEVITWSSGTFTLRAVDEEPTANCNLPNEALLLEGCRRLDEKASSKV